MKADKKAIPYVTLIILAASLILNLFQANMIFKGHNNIIETSVQAKSDSTKEEYVWVGPMADYSMYVNHDQRALKQFAGDMKVKVTIEGPSTYDIPQQIAAIEAVIKRKPAGIMVLGAENSLAEAINKAVDAGIPTITVDSDVSNSRRLAFVGSDWYTIGVKQGEAMVKLIAGKGKVAMLGTFGCDNTTKCFAGFKSIINKYPDITLLGEYDDITDVEESQRITAQLLKEHSDIAGIAGFDSCSGPGIAAALKEADMVGKVKVTTMDIEPIHLQLVKEGVIHKLIGQKRELFTYYGAKLLYDMNHSTISLSKDDEKNGITPIPYTIDTGLIEVDKSNVDAFDGGVN